MIIYRRKYKSKITKEEFISFKKSYTKAKKLHSFYLSTTKQKFYKFAHYLLVSLTIILPILLTTFFTFVFQPLLKHLVAPSNERLLSSISNWLIGASSAIFLGLLIQTVLFGFNNDKELFNQKILKIFLKMRFARGYTFRALYFIDFLYYVLLLISYFLSDFYAVASTFVFFLFYSLIIFIKALSFIINSNTKNYFAYLKSNFQYTTPTTHYAIKNNFDYLNFFNSEKDFKDLFTIQSFIYFKEFDVLIEHLMKTLQEGKNITKEQNIVEDYIIYLMKGTRSVSQPLFASILLHQYKKLYSQTNNLTLLKDINLSKSKLINLLSYKETKLKELSDFQIDITRFYKFINYYNEFFKLISIVNELTTLQSGLYISYSALIHSFDSKTKHPDNVLNAIKKYTKNNEELKKNYHGNLDSIKALINKYLKNKF